MSFGTSGHRGSAFTATFNEDHILATTQAICEYRAAHGIDGPLYLGADTHALSEPATVSALEVLAANGVRVLVDSRGGYTPTPAVSRAILVAQRGRATGPQADGIVVTPSHNPPPDGGFKYNPPDGGPAGTDITRQIQDRANELLGRRAEGRAPGAVRAGDGGRHHRHVRLPRQLRGGPGPGGRPGRDQARPGSASAPTRSAAPASPTGARSASATAST